MVVGRRHVLSARPWPPLYSHYTFDDDLESLEKNVWCKTMPSDTCSNSNYKELQSFGLTRRIAPYLQRKTAFLNRQQWNQCKIGVLQIHVNTAIGEVYLYYTYRLHEELTAPIAQSGPDSWNRPKWHAQVVSHIFLLSRLVPFSSKLYIVQRASSHIHGCFMKTI